MNKNSLDLLRLVAAAMVLYSHQYALLGLASTPSRIVAQYELLSSARGKRQPIPMMASGAALAVVVWVPLSLALSLAWSCVTRGTP